MSSNKENLLAIINQTPSAKIAELDFVKTRFIENYNLANNSKDGDLMYHRQLVFFNQQLTSSDSLQNADKFSLYACFVTAAVNGYSFDPEDNEVYLIARGGRAKLERQAGAHVRRLIRTGQVKFVEQSKIVYEGDVFEVENGRVIRHVEKYQSDKVIAGYVRFVLDEKGTDRFFIYRKSDFAAWRKKSPNPATIEKKGAYGPYLSESLWDNGIVGGTEAEPGFLRTKIIKHACKEKCWATGSTPAGIEAFSVEVDSDEVLEEMNLPTEPETTPEKNYADFEELEKMDEQPAEMYDDDSF